MNVLTYPIALADFRPTAAGHPLAAMRAPRFLPDAVSSALFESHWSWWFAAAAVGAILLLLGRSRADARLVKTALITFAGTLLWVLAALLFDTPAERLYAVHHDLADAAKQGDVNRILSHLSNDFTASALDIKANTPAKDEISRRLKDYGIKSVTFLAYKSTQHDASALTTINLLTEAEKGNVMSEWQLSWDDVPDNDWKIVHAKLLSLNDQPVPQEMVLP